MTSTRPSRWIRWLVIACTILVASPVPAEEETLTRARSLQADGVEAFQAAVARADRPGQDAAVEILREALALYTRHLEQNPEDEKECEPALMEINSILFWHGRMSVPDTGADTEPTREQEQARREEKAARLLAEAEQIARDDPQDLHAGRAAYREVVIQFPGTDAAARAVDEIVRIDGRIARRRAGRSDPEPPPAEPEEGEPARLPPEVEIAPPVVVVMPLLEELETRQAALEGSPAESALRDRLTRLLQARRFVEARDACRAALREAGKDQASENLARIQTGLARAVTLMDHAVAELRGRVGGPVALVATGGARFEGTLLGLGWKGVSLRTDTAEMDLPLYRMSDEMLVRLAGQRQTADATLAAAAYQALAGKGENAAALLELAAGQGADAAEVEDLRVLAGGEAERVRVAKEIRKERRRWSPVDRAFSRTVKAHGKQDHLGFLRELLKLDEKVELTDRDLAWLSQELEAETGVTLLTAIRTARETCSRTHPEGPLREVTCENCNGRGRVPARKSGRLFGPKGDEIVQCGYCRGKGVVPCPECAARFHDARARALQDRLAR